LKTWPIRAILVVQTILSLAHYFLYRTWLHFGWPLSFLAQLGIHAALFLLSFSFILACMLAFRYADPVTAFIYKCAVLWLGFLHLLFLAACLAWLSEPVSLLLSHGMRAAVRSHLAAGLLIAVVVFGIIGLINARIIRVRRVSIQLPNLPDSWRGRTALLLTDLHLGDVNGVRFARRIARMARALNPAIIFIAGDLYDGLADIPLKLAQPIIDLTPPLGIFFVTGNHEQFGGTARYTDELQYSPVNVIDDRSVFVDGLRIIGVSYQRSTSPITLRSFLESLHLDPAQPSILLNHVPHRLPIVADCGVSLQLSGHTHSGQIFPFTFIARRAFGQFTHGLAHLGKLQVFTSSGAGTWGPPMRLGSSSEVVLITFS
jgi:uncharacterized protein